MNYQQNRLKMYNFLIDIGFVDITDKAPIIFTETLIGVDSYRFDKRFIKSNGEMVTMVIIGNGSNFINICCKTCLGSHFSMGYKVAIPAKYQEEVIKNLIQANEEYIMKEFKYEQSIYNME